jgi:hypothetical protein
MCNLLQGRKVAFFLEKKPYQRYFCGGTALPAGTAASYHMHALSCALSCAALGEQ